MISSKHSWLEGLAVACFSGGVMAFVQYTSPYIVGYDGYYHIKLAYLMRAEGWFISFDWLPLTILNAREFVDHHFLFHILLMPFTFGDLVSGAKLASVLFPVLMFLSIWRLLKKEGAAYAWLWTLGLLVISEAFLYRMSMPRVQALSLATLALGMHFLLRERNWALFVLGWLYVWLFDGFPLMLVIALAYSVAVWLSESRIVWRPLAYSFAGITAGLLVNPYFPKNLAFIYRHIVPKIGSPYDIWVGSEWYPYTTGQLLENSGLALVLLALAFLFVGLTDKRTDAKVTFGMLLVFGFGAMLLQSRRFIEYFPAMVIIFGALSLKALIESRPKMFSRYKPMVALLAVALLVPAGWFTVKAASLSIAASQDSTRYQGAATWLVENTTGGERIFHTDWDDFPELFFHDHHNTYLVGLDPTYLQLYDSELYTLWVALTRGQISLPASVIANVYHSRYVFSDLNHEAFISEAEKDPNMLEVFRDEHAIIFHIALPISE